MIYLKGRLTETHTHTHFICSFTLQMPAKVKTGPRGHQPLRNSYKSLKLLREIQVLGLASYLPGCTTGSLIRSRAKVAGDIAACNAGISCDCHLKFQLLCLSFNTLPTHLGKQEQKVQGLEPLPIHVGDPNGISSWPSARVIFRVGKSLSLSKPPFFL